MVSIVVSMARDALVLCAGQQQCICSVQRAVVPACSVALVREEPPDARSVVHDAQHAVGHTLRVHGAQHAVRGMQWCCA